MNDKDIRQLTQELIDKDRWVEILQRFIDVLRVNIFMVDHQGKAFLTPCMGRYGWKFLEMSPAGMDLLKDDSRMMDKFKQHGFYLEYQYPFDLHLFAVPIYGPRRTAVAYLIIGPVILNRRLGAEHYEKIALEFGMEPSDLLDALGEIRTISFVGIKSILDLLDEVSRYTVQLKSQKYDLSKLALNSEGLGEEISRDAQDILSSIFLDELLATFLDMAMKMTRTECGSIMVLDEETGELTIKVSRGLKKDIINRARTRVGEGVAGVVAEERTPLFIEGTQSAHNRIQEHLKRPDIKFSLVTPLKSADKLYGVLNLSSRKDAGPSGRAGLDSILLLTEMTSAAINTIQQKSSSTPLQK